MPNLSTDRCIRYHHRQLCTLTPLTDVFFSDTVVCFLTPHADIFFNTTGRHVFQRYRQVRSLASQTGMFVNATDRYIL